MRLVDNAKKNGNAEVMRDGKVKMRPGRLPGMIVLCPTRELARQVSEELDTVCKELGLYSTVFHGGVSYGPQVSSCVLGESLMGAGTMLTFLCKCLRVVTGLVFRPAPFAGEWM